MRAVYDGGTAMFGHCLNEVQPAGN